MAHPFQIELLDQHWLADDVSHDDKCSHGRLRVSMAGREITDPTEDNYGISTSALSLLRTLESDHGPNDPSADRLVLHGCGAILMMACPIGVDWSVRHHSDYVALGDAVTYPTTHEADALQHPDVTARVPLADYRVAVLGLAAAVDEFFRLQPARVLDDRSISRTMSSSGTSSTTSSSGRVISNKRIKLARRSVGGLTGGRRARSLSAVRWTDAGAGA